MALGGYSVNDFTNDIKTSNVKFDKLEKRTINLTSRIYAMTKMMGRESDCGRRCI